MATKKEMLKDAQARGLVGEDVTEDDMTAADLETLLDPSPVAWKGSLSSKKPLVGPDGHVHLSQEDIDARQ